MHAEGFGSKFRLLFAIIERVSLELIEEAEFLEAQIKSMMDGAALPETTQGNSMYS